VLGVFRVPIGASSRISYPTYVEKMVLDILGTTNQRRWGFFEALRCDLADEEDEKIFLAGWELREAPTDLHDQSSGEASVALLRDLEREQK
jgi:hypothetical protein